MSIVKKVIGIGMLLGTLGVMGMLWFSNSLPTRSSFDRSLWLSNNTYTMNNPRFRMVEDLMSHHVRIGMSRQQVVTLLGEPTGESFISAQGVYFYILGTEYSDPSFLCVKFDPQERVLNVSRFDR